MYYNKSVLRTSATVDKHIFLRYKAVENGDVSVSTNYKNVDMNKSMKYMSFLICSGLKILLLLFSETTGNHIHLKKLHHKHFYVCIKNPYISFVNRNVLVKTGTAPRWAGKSPQCICGRGGYQQHVQAIDTFKEINLKNDTERHILLTPLHSRHLDNSPVCCAQL